MRLIFLFFQGLLFSSFFSSFCISYCLFSAPKRLTYRLYFYARLQVGYTSSFVTFSPLCSSKRGLNIAVGIVAGLVCLSCGRHLTHLSHTFFLLPLPSLLPLFFFLPFTCRVSCIRTACSQGASLFAEVFGVWQHFSQVQFIKISLS